MPRLQFRHLVKAELEQHPDLGLTHGWFFQTLVCEPGRYLRYLTGLLTEVRELKITLIHFFKIRKCGQAGALVGA